jgi:hypothetical protein
MVPFRAKSALDERKKSLPRVSPNKENLSSLFQLLLRQTKMSAAVNSPLRCKRTYDYILSSPDSPTSPTTKGKKPKYEYDLTNLGYYADPIKPNLFMLAPGPGMLELRKECQVPFKRHQSKVRAILPPRSQSLFTSSCPSMSSGIGSLSSSRSSALFHHSVPSNSHHLPSSSSQTTTLATAQEQQLQQLVALQHQQETDDEILSSLASIATSFDDEMDEIEAVFLHFSEE